MSEQHIKFKLSKKQTGAMRVLHDDVTQFLLYGGAARGGKSVLGCLWEFTQCVKYDGIRYFIGRNELKRLKQSTLVTMYKILKEYGLNSADFFSYNGQENQLRFHNGSVIDLLDMKYMPSDPLYERFGSLEYTGGWIEEAGEVNHAAFDVLKARVGQYMNDQYNIPSKLLITSNPKKNWLYNEFYLPWRNGSLPKTHRFIQAFVQDNIFAEKGSAQRLANIKIKSQRERLLNGNWEYSDEPDQLIPYDLVYSAVGRKVPDDKVTIDHALGVDVARFGDDKSVIARIENNVLKEIRQYQGLRTTELAEKVAHVMQMHRIMDTCVSVDGDGLGGGVLDSLSEKGIGANEIHSGGKPSFEFDKDFGIAYANARTQMWMQFKEMLQDEAFGIDASLEQEKYFDNLISDITSVKYKVLNDKAIALENKDHAKKRLGRSPDLGDGIVYGTCAPRDEFFFAMV